METKNVESPSNPPPDSKVFPSQMPPPSRLDKLLFKIPIIKKFKEHDLSSWSNWEIFRRAISEGSSYISWRMKNYLKIRHYGLHQVKKYGQLDFSKLSTPEILSVAKHEGHRIEKAFYAGYMKTVKYSTYYNARENIAKALSILKERGEFDDRPDTAWLQMIHDSFYEFDTLIEHSKKSAPNFEPQRIKEFVDVARERRSTRTWAEPNISKEKLPDIAKDLVECAKWSPCSGNRQPWYFKILIDDDDKKLLQGIKEAHCINAPLVIFVGINRSSYGAIGIREQGIHVDGGAVAMQMVMAAHQAGLGSCWNHFCKDFVYSRPKNLPIFKNFYKKLGIPEDIEPISLIAFGLPAFISLPPERPPFEVLCPKLVPKTCQNK